MQTVYEIMQAKLAEAGITDSVVITRACEGAKEYHKQMLVYEGEQALNNLSKSVTDVCEEMKYKLRKML